jgi:hypothetical protein
MLTTAFVAHAEWHPECETRRTVLRRLGVQVIGSQFSHPGEPGDFSWMIERPEYDDALFIFNDNEEQFLAYLKDQTPKTYGCRDGKGNALIRHYRCTQPPRAAGVPTGWIQKTPPVGYPALTDAVRGVIDEALAVIKTLVASGRYQRIFYSVDKDGNLGHGIFDPADAVKSYIVTELNELGN